MRFHSMIEGLAIAAASIGAGDVASDPHDRERRGKGKNNRRGKGLQAKPRKRRNMVTVSKRVRLKHRRAAK
jgi:hypothetical protein